MRKPRPTLLPLLCIISALLWTSNLLYAQKIIIKSTPDPQLPEDASIIDMSVGGQVRIIPVYEQNWDMGMADNNSKDLKEHAGKDPATALADGASALTVIRLARGTNGDPRIHTTDTGRVSNEYWKTEARITFDFKPQDKKWSLYLALECDTIWDSADTDARCRNFGLERLNGMMAIPGLNTELHAGWDLYFVDVVVKQKPFLSLGGPVSIYGDDDPGIWFKGKYENIGWQIGFHKKFERNAIQNAQTRGADVEPLANSPDPESIDPDRNVYDAVLSYEFLKSRNVLKLMWVQDHIKQISDATAETIAKNEGIAETDSDFPSNNPSSMLVISNYYGVLYHGTFVNEIFSFTTEYVRQIGEAVNTGICPVSATDPTTGACLKGGDDDYKIDSYLFFINLTTGIWRGFTKGTGATIGWSYLETRGDATDNQSLSGFTGVTAGQRFSQQIGTEHSYLGEENIFTLGTQLFGYIPEYHGSRGQFGQQGVSIGGVAAGSDPLNRHTWGGRGDNPGLRMQNLRLDARYSKSLVFRANYREIQFRESFYPYLTTGINGKRIHGGKRMGTELTTELYYFFNWNVIMQFAYARFEPGAGMKDLVKAYTGKSSTQPVDRLAMEFIWRF